VEGAVGVAELLLARVEEIFDFSVRVYEGRKDSFVLHPADDDDYKCRQVETIFRFLEPFWVLRMIFGLLERFKLIELFLIGCDFYWVIVVGCVFINSRR